MRRGEVLARVGSAGYFDDQRAGQVDMTNALRSPGSTLKPFIYGLGFEDGLIHPETLIDDRPVRYGAYAPENFDLTFQGTVAIRKALQMSLNVPAVAVLDKVGAGRFTARLRQAGGDARASQGRGSRARHGPRRRRRAAFRSGEALCRARAARHHGAAHRAHAGGGTAGGGRGAARRKRRRRAGSWSRSRPGMSAAS